MISTVENSNHSENRGSVHGERGLRTKILPSTGAAIDLCCGLGGLSLAAKDLGLNVVAGVDLNAHALKTFFKNFPDAQSIQGSVRSKLVLSKCEKLFEAHKAAGTPTIILSGPPCQGFSIAGSRDPADPRNQVLVAVARAICKLTPDCALIENVSMLLADMHGTRVKQFQKILTDGGYYVTHIVLDASEFGVPQKRKRAFFLITKSPLDQQALVARLDHFKTSPINSEQALTGLPKPKIRPDDYDDETNYDGFYNHFAMQHSARVITKIAAITPGTGPMSYRKLHPTRLSNTLFSGHRAPPAHFKEPRSITVREAARLQGFPDNFRIYGSFGNQMEQVTNAVPPPLTRAVLRALLDLAEICLP